MRLALAIALGVAYLALAVGGTASGERSAVAEVDLLTFAAGALPVGLGKGSDELGVGYEQAIAAVDGNPGKFVLNRKLANGKATIEFAYELPALTAFTEFRVPAIVETPSPAQSFVGRIEIYGSTKSATAGLKQLAAADLTAHTGPDQVTTIPARPSPQIRWVTVRLSGSLEPGAGFVEFSEIEGYGRQRAQVTSRAFTGSWDARFGEIELRQRGVVVEGCFDDGRGRLTGTVSGRLLVASGRTRSSGTRSSFILAVAPGKVLRGVRSDNSAPFGYYEGARLPRPQHRCLDPKPSPTPVLGCGSIVHGIHFEFDSAVIRRESSAVLTAVAMGLRRAKGTITIEGHTSSEGSDEYNRQLSARRAQAVVNDLVRRGLVRSRLRAVGKGEGEPIASNDDESGRSLNRRVEIACG